MKLFYNGQSVELYHKDNKIWFDYKNEAREVIKLDDRYILNSNSFDLKILYPYDFIMENTRVLDQIKPYREFIEKYLESYEYISWCERCTFGVFEFMSEDNHGGWFSECDNYPEKCSDDIYVKYDIECQRCDYKLCYNCENNINFDDSKLEFNILLTAIIVVIDIGNFEELIDEIILDFPSEDDIIPEVIKWLNNYLLHGDESKHYREIWTFTDEHDIKRCVKYLESLY